MEKQSVIQTFLSKIFARTPDEELADNLKKAIKEYNRALQACEGAGLKVTLRNNYANTGFSSKFLFGGYIVDVKVSRINRRYF